MPRPLNKAVLLRHEMEPLTKWFDDECLRECTRYFRKDEPEGHLWESMRVLYGKVYGEKELKRLEETAKNKKKGFEGLTYTIAADLFEAVDIAVPSATPPIFETAEAALHNDVENAARRITAQMTRRGRR